MSGTNTHTRRNFLTIAPSTGLSAMMAGAIPVEAAMPDDDWLAQIMAHVECILEILNDSAPQEVSITGFEFRCDDDGVIPESVWATGYREGIQHPGSRGLVHARPGISSPWRGNGEYL